MGCLRKNASEQMLWYDNFADVACSSRHGVIVTLGYSDTGFYVFSVSETTPAVIFLIYGHFYVALMFLTTLLSGMNIFSEKPTVKYYGSAFTALLILVNGSMAEGAEFSELLIKRILLIVLAIIYIIGVLKILDSYWPEKNAGVQTCE